MTVRRVFNLLLSRAYFFSEETVRLSPHVVKYEAELKTAFLLAATTSGLQSRDGKMFSCVNIVNQIGDSRFRIVQNAILYSRILKGYFTMSYKHHC